MNSSNGGRNAGNGRGLLSAFLVFLTLQNFSTAVPADETSSHPLVLSWVHHQTNIQTWAASLVQTRSLKSLTHPLVSTGRVWFAAPNQFRWELGTPPQTIAFRQTNEMWIVYPRLKRAERYPLTGTATGPWREALGLLEAGFPRTETELNGRFKIAAVVTSNNFCELALQPKSASARQMMPQLKVMFETNTFYLQATEIQFADGSTMRNDFFDGQINTNFPASVLVPVIPEGFKITEPLKDSKRK